MNHKILGYGRASTSKQVASPEVQEFQIQKWFQDQKSISKMDGFEFGGFWADKAVSGSTQWFRRPQAQVMLLAAQPGDIIVVAIYDRAIRSAKDACQCIEDLEAKKLKVKFLDNPMLDTSTIDGQMMFQVLSAFTERERKMISKRIKEHYAWARENGLPINGKAPAGWRVGQDADGRPQFEPDPHERHIGEFVVQLRDVEGLSHRRVHKRVKAAGIRNPKTGNPYNFDWIRMIYHDCKAGWPHPAILRKQKAERLVSYKSY